MKKVKFNRDKYFVVFGDEFEVKLKEKLTPEKVTSEKLEDTVYSIMQMFCDELLD